MEFRSGCKVKFGLVISTVNSPAYETTYKILYTPEGKFLQ
jgi:hypothetical protein